MPFLRIGPQHGDSHTTMVPNCKGTDEGSEGRSNDHSGRSAVEDPTLVPFPPEHAGGYTNSITRHPRSDHFFPKLRLPSVGNSAPAGHMEGLRHHFRSKEIPNNAIELLVSSWRSKTISNYNSAWRKWEGWCKQRGMHPFAADVSSIRGFLSDQFEEGRQYRSLNCYRSALSSTHLPLASGVVSKLICWTCLHTDTTGLIEWHCTVAA